MKYIKSVEIRNFQSHYNSYIELDPYLNVIVGPSDSGKTSIIRAIKWVLYNEPSGSAFVREGEDVTSVILNFNDNTKVERERNKTKNIYRIKYPDEEELELSGFGLSLPKEVEAATGVRKINLDKDFTNNINIAEQLEGPFLLSEKNSTKAGAIGGLVGVDIIDESVVDVLKDLRNLGIEEKANQDEIDNLNEKLKDFEDLDSEIISLEKLKKIYNTIEFKMQKKNSLEKCRLSLENYKSEEGEIVTLINKLSGISRLRNIDTKLRDNLTSYQNQIDLNTKYKKTVVYIEESLIILEKLRELNNLQYKKDKLTDKIALIDKLLKIRDRKMEVYQNSEAINEIIRKLESTTHIKQVQDQLELLTSRLEHMHSINGKLVDLEDRLERGEKYSVHFQNLENIDIKRIESTIKTHERLYSSHNVLLKLNKEEDKISISLNSIEESLQKYLQSYSSLLNEKKVCPYCLSKIDKDQIEKIEENFSMSSK